MTTISSPKLLSLKTTPRQKQRRTEVVLERTDSMGKQAKKKKLDRIKKDRKMLVKWAKTILKCEHFIEEDLFDASGVFLLNILNLVAPTQKLEFQRINIKTTQIQDNLKEYQQTLVDVFQCKKELLFGILEVSGHPLKAYDLFVPSLVFLKNQVEKKGQRVDLTKTTRNIKILKTDLDPNDQINSYLLKKDGNSTKKSLIIKNIWFDWEGGEQDQWLIPKSSSDDESDEEEREKRKIMQAKKEKNRKLEREKVMYSRNVFKKKIQREKSKIIEKAQNKSLMESIDRINDLKRNKKKKHPKFNHNHDLKQKKYKNDQKIEKIKKTKRRIKKTKKPQSNLQRKNKSQILKLEKTIKYINKKIIKLDLEIENTEDQIKINQIEFEKQKLENRHQRIEKRLDQIKNNNAQLISNNNLNLSELKHQRRKSFQIHSMNNFANENEWPQEKKDLDSLKKDKKDLNSCRRELGIIRNANKELKDKIHLISSEYEKVENLNQIQLIEKEMKMLQSQFQEQLKSIRQRESLLLDPKRNQRHYKNRKKNSKKTVLKSSKNDENNSYKDKKNKNDMKKNTINISSTNDKNISNKKKKKNNKETIVINNDDNNKKNRNDNKKYKNDKDQTYNRKKNKEHQKDTEILPLENQSKLLCKPTIIPKQKLKSSHDKEEKKQKIDDKILQMKRELLKQKNQFLKYHTNKLVQNQQEFGVNPNGDKGITNKLTDQKKILTNLEDQFKNLRDNVLEKISLQNSESSYSSFSYSDENYEHSNKESSSKPIDDNDNDNDNDNVNTNSSSNNNNTNNNINNNKKDKENENNNKFNFRETSENKDGLHLKISNDNIDPNSDKDQENKQNEKIIFLETSTEKNNELELHSMSVRTSSDDRGEKDMGIPFLSGSDEKEFNFDGNNKNQEQKLKKKESKIKLTGTMEFTKTFKESGYHCIEPDKNSPYFDKKCARQVLRKYVKNNQDHNILETFMLINTFDEWKNLSLNAIRMGKTFRELLNKEMGVFNRSLVESKRWCRLQTFSYPIKIDNTGNEIFRKGKLWVEKKKLYFTLEGTGVFFEVKWKKKLEILINIKKKNHFLLVNAKGNHLYLKVSNSHQRRVLILTLLRFLSSKGKDKIIGKNSRAPIPTNEQIDLSVLPPLIKTKKKSRRYEINSNNLKILKTKKQVNRFIQAYHLKGKMIFLIHVVVGKLIPFHPGFFSINQNSITLTLHNKSSHEFKFSKRIKLEKISQNPRLFEIIIDEKTNKKTIKKQKTTIVAKSKLEREILMNSFSFFYSKWKD
ncbi:ubiquitin-like protease 2 [Anaeramoeba flamelloides]|uniref:Ubiquitin-like protease 2 n=1 Tax=Anaeramoeba flamelloides TaxID=1746091 RepID=A0ABQ8Y2I4_9EUKA|nr:ubiquitin-like protease 2 [Anaeramoeba flamelloides]